MFGMNHSTGFKPWPLLLLLVGVGIKAAFLWFFVASRELFRWPATPFNDPGRGAPRDVLDPAAKGSYTRQVGLTISFGSARVQQASAGVATCLTEDIRQEVQNSVATARAVETRGGAEGDAGGARLQERVAALLAGFLDDVSDTVLRTFVSWAFHMLDTALAWLLGLVRGMTW